VEFVRTGKPAAEGLPVWSQYDSKSRNVMHLNTKSKVMPDIDADMLEIFLKNSGSRRVWRNFYNRLNVKKPPEKAALIFAEIINLLF